MTRILTIIAATTFSLGAVSLAQAGDAKMMMEGYAACNAGYMQCVKDGTDLTLAATPAEGAEKIKMNITHGQECGAAYAACSTSVK